jgi:SAM-dependent methyltransferase
MRRFIVDIDFYKNAYSRDKTPWTCDEPERVFQRFLERLKSENYFSHGDVRFLDLGCGEGRHIKLLKEIFPNSKVFAFDIIREPILKAQQKLKGRYSFFPCVANAFFSPFKDKSFDLVLDFGVFHHIRVKDTKVYKSELIRILKDGGFFLIGVFSEKYKHHEKEQRKRNFIYHRKHYDRFFTEKSLKDEFSFSFEPIEVVEEGKGLEWFIYGLFKKI